MSEDNQLTETTKNPPMSEDFFRQFAELMRNGFAHSNSPENPNHGPYRIDNQPLQIGLKLSGDNYPLWAVLIKKEISGRGMDSHITGVPPPPPRTDQNYTQWQQADHRVFTWLVNSLEPRLVSRVSQQPTAKHVWDALAVTYSSGGDKIQLYDLHQKASNLKQMNNSLEDVWSTLQEIWIAIDQRITNSMLYPEDVVLHDQFIQEQRLYQLLTAIDNKYEAIKREIIKLDPLPSVEHAYGMIRRDETQQQVLHPGSSGGVATDGIGT